MVVAPAPRPALLQTQIMQRASSRRIVISEVKKGRSPKATVILRCDYIWIHIPRESGRSINWLYTRYVKNCESFSPKIFFKAVRFIVCKPSPAMLRKTFWSGTLLVIYSFDPNPNPFRGILSRPKVLKHMEMSKFRHESPNQM